MIKKPKKSLGQNYLIDNNILKLISSAENINADNDIMEIGPGTGNLTKYLSQLNFNKFVAIEKDSYLYKKLIIKFNKINLINEDFLRFNLKKIYLKNLIIYGNLPYNISSQILIKLIKEYNENFKFKKLILMFQKELADRILAKHDTNEYGRISIISQWKMNIKKLKDVSPESFSPKPKVDSSILIFTPKNHYPKIKNHKNLEHMTNVFFNLRRKMIKKPMHILFEDVLKVSKNLNLDLDSRPQTIEPELYYKLCQEYEKLL